MDRELFLAASKGILGYFDALGHPESILLEVTIGKNTALHVALQFNQFEAAKKIVYLRPSLVYETNSKDNTALHVAARWVESSSIVKLIIQKAKEGRDAEAGGQQLLRMVNQDGDTALHVAVRYNNFNVVKDLIEEDREELAKYVNKAGESALFLAVDREFYDMASHILSAAPECSCAGRHGMNVLHALVIRTSSFTLRELKNYGRASACHRFMVSWVWVVKMVFSRNPLTKFQSRELENYSFRKVFALVRGKFGTFPAIVEAVINKWPCTIEQVDDSGWTPLHIAAHLGNDKIIKLILVKEKSSAYAKNKEGLSALHIAAMEGNLRVMKELMEACPDIYELLDNRGQTALHAAAESGQLLPFTALRGSLRFESLMTLISEQNKEGNTPFYLAVIKGYFMSLKLLESFKGVDLNATNKEGFTTMDKLFLGRASFGLEVWKRDQIKPLWDKGARPSLRGAMALRNLDPGSRRQPEQAGNGDGDGDGNGEGSSVSDYGNGDGEGRSVSDFGKRVSDTNLLVATLIATMTFTAAFTVPGGYNQNGNADEGLAVLRKNTAFLVFLIANTLAFGLSTTSVFVHFLGSAAITGNFFLREVVRHSLTFTNWSVGALLVAFISGTYAVVPHSWGTTVAITLCCCFLISLFFPLFIKKYY